MTKDKALKMEDSDFKNHSKQQLFEYIVYLREALFTHPASSWQGLSDDEIEAIDDVTLGDYYEKQDAMDFARAIEQALKEKNT